VQGYKNKSTKRGSSVILIFFMDIVRNWIYIYAMRWAKKLTHTHRHLARTHKQTQRASGVATLRILSLCLCTLVRTSFVRI